MNFANPTFGASRGQQGEDGEDGELYADAPGAGQATVSRQTPLPYHCFDTNFLMVLRTLLLKMGAVGFVVLGHTSDRGTQDVGAAKLTKPEMLYAPAGCLVSRSNRRRTKTLARVTRPGACRSPVRARWPTPYTQRRQLGRWSQPTQPPPTIWGPVGTTIWVRLVGAEASRCMTMMIRCPKKRFEAPRSTASTPTADKQGHVPPTNRPMVTHARLTGRVKSL